MTWSDGMIRRYAFIELAFAAGFTCCVRPAPYLGGIKPPEHPIWPAATTGDVIEHRELSGIYSDDEGNQVALLPLAIFPERPLVAVIPDGKGEGLIHFASPNSENRTTGLWSPARRPYMQIPLDAVVGPKRLEIRFPANVYAASKRRAANLGLVVSTPIVCHRILGIIRATVNARSAIEIARRWGCAGIEVDVGVLAIGRGRHRAPDFSRFWVAHPPALRAELGRDWLRLRDLDRAATFRDVMSTADKAGLKYVYVDPKLEWLDRKAKRTVLSRLRAIAASHESILTLVAAPTHAVAQAVHDVGLQRWLPESTKGTRDAQFVEYLTQRSGRPAALSFNLMRLRNSGKRILPSVEVSLERAFATSSYPIVFWSAESDRVQRGAVRVLRRWRRYSEGCARMAVMSDRPHATLWALASAR